MAPRVLVVLGQTPRFHCPSSRTPSLVATTGAEQRRCRRWTSWKTYVAKVVRRYKGRGVDYQIWNEANVVGFWAGSPAKMAELTRVAAKIVNSNDAGAKVVSPALATRLSGQRKWLRRSTRSGPVDRLRALDRCRVAESLPGDEGAAGAPMALLAASRSMLSAAGVHKPIWNTEINYGLQTGGGGTAARISEKRQASYVARTYVLNAANGVQKVFWYSWGLQRLANTRLTYAGGSLTPAGRAYGTVHDWLVGARVASCARDGRGTYHCVAKYSGGVRHIFWNPTRKVSIKTPATTTSWTNLGGVSTRIRANKSLAVDFAPKMVRSRR